MTWAYHIQQCLTSALDGTITVAVSAATAQPLKVRASDDRDSKLVHVDIMYHCYCLW
jgi:hypothetical protein